MKRNKTYNLLFACLLSAGALLTACSEDLGQTEVPASSEAVTFRVEMAGTAEVKARGEENLCCGSKTTSSAYSRKAETWHII